MVLTVDNMTYLINYYNCNFNQRIYVSYDNFDSQTLLFVI
jgi:hypothetical protein